MQDSAPLSTHSSLCPTRRGCTLHAVVVSYASSLGHTRRRLVLCVVVGSYTLLSGPRRHSGRVIFFVILEVVWSLRLVGVVVEVVGDAVAIAGHRPC